MMAVSSSWVAGTGNMDAFQQALAIGAVITALICIGDRRSLAWIFAGSMSFLISVAYARMVWPYPTAITALCDVVFCLLIYRFRRERWEKYLFLLFQGSVLVSMAYLAGVIGPHWAYVAALEGINWAALVLIGGTRIAGLLKNARVDIGWVKSAIRAVDRSLHANVHTEFRHKR